MSTSETYPHLIISEDGVARLGASRYKVQQLATEHYCYGWSAEELLKQHPDLRPEQVYSALTYFYDHYDKMVERMHVAAKDAAELRNAQKLTRAELLARQSKGT